MIELLERKRSDNFSMVIASNCRVVFFNLRRPFLVLSKQLYARKRKVGEFKNLWLEENHSKEETLGRIFQNIILNFSKSTVHNSTPAFESTN